jgi:NAD(P)-dependent dehydrogenase (short-subunit alcohol dehydrogenase family)
MRTAAKEAVMRGIRVNSVHPGPADTDSQRDIEIAATGAPAEMAAQLFNAMIPMARHAHRDEIARSVLYLASDDSSFVTGCAAGRRGMRI